MKIKTYNDAVSAAATVCDTKLELPIETEILIPDYLPQVFKIVKCFVHLVVLQKQISSSRLTLEGYMRLSMFYQSDGEDNLCQTEQKLPFTKQIDLAQGEYFATDITVSGEPEYINCRAVNQRRVDVRGAYALNVCANAQVAKQIIATLSEGGVEQKTTSLLSDSTIAVQDKIITAEETITFDIQPEAVLDIACSTSVQEIKLIAGKAVVKGTIDADVLFRANGLHHTSKEVSFNEIVEIDAATENCKGIAFVKTTGCTLLTGDDQKTTLTITAILTVKVYCPVQIEAVSDAFSTKYETLLAFDKVYTEQKLDEFHLQVEAAAEGSMPDTEAQILTAFATSMQPELLQQNDKTAIRGRVIVHIMCRNALGEIDCYDKACEYILPVSYSVSKDELVLTARANVVEVSAKKAGENMSAAVLLRVDGMITKRIEHTVLQQITCGDEHTTEKTNIALRIYYAKQGEPLFDIARRYSVSPSAIANANEISGDVIEKRTQLLVPSLLQ